MAIASEEVFGPVLSVMSIRDDDEAIALANATDYGLVGGIFTRDIDRAPAPPDVSKPVRSLSMSGMPAVLKRLSAAMANQAMAGKRAVRR